MFWEKWIPQKYLIKPSVCGVEVLMGTNGQQFYGCVVKNQDGKLSLGSSFHSSQKPELPEELKKNKIPLVLCITGQGLINKKISLPDDSEPGLEEIIAQHLPTIQADEFYVQLHRQENGQHFLSVIRKSQLDAILALFSQSRQEVAGVIIGPAFISGVGPLVAGFTKVDTTSYALELANNSVETITETVPQQETAGITLDMEGLLLTKENLLGFCAAFAYLTHSLDGAVMDAQLARYHNRHLQANKLRVLSYFFISIAFLFCLVNFFVFNHYFGNSKKLETELSIYQGKYDQINELLSSYEKQKGLIEQAGILNGNNISKYSDKIAATIPDDVALTEWVFNPANEDVEEDSLMHFSANTVIIKGNCNKSLIINEWLNVLKSQNFIKDINLEKFSFSNEGTQPNFELKIQTE